MTFESKSLCNIKFKKGEKKKKKILYKYQFVLINVAFHLMVCLLLQGIWMQEKSVGEGLKWERSDVKVYCTRSLGVDRGK